MTRLGFRVLRFCNEDVLTKTDEVVEEIVRVLECSEGLNPLPDLALSLRPSSSREKEAEVFPSGTFSFQE